METIGSVFDKISILSKRREVMQGEGYEKISDQLSYLIKDIAQIIDASIKKERPWAIPKLKQYDKSTKIEKNYNLISLIAELDALNRNLWELEDERRDVDNVSDEDRLEAADQISVFNKKRNDAIDAIDELIASYFEVRYR